MTVCDFCWNSQLQEALEQLRSYQKKHEKMKMMSEKMMSEQAGRADKIRSDVEFDRFLEDRKDKKQPLMGEY